jgi:FixJ family two-component response regulator
MLPPPQQPQGPGPVTVVIVDDDDSVRQGMRRLLAAEGYRVDSFPSARTFLESTPSSDQACLLLDFRMPGLSGLDLQWELKKSGRVVPIVFMTGHADIPTCVKAMKWGALDFLTKPIDEARLLSVVAHAVESHRKARAALAELASARALVESLTPRERDVMDLVVTGLLNKQIAGELGISEATVKVHRGRVMRKLRVMSVAELVKMVSRLGGDTTKV